MAYYAGKKQEEMKTKSYILLVIAILTVGFFSALFFKKYKEKQTLKKEFLIRQEVHRIA